MDGKSTKHQPLEELVARLDPEGLSSIMLNVIPGLFYLVDPGGNLRLWNPRLQKVTGYSEADLAGMKILDFFDERIHNRVLAAIRKCLDRGSAMLDAPINLSRGRTLPFHFYSQQVEISGEQLIAGVALDVTRLKDAEEEHLRQRRQLERLAMHVPGMFFQLHLDAGTRKFTLPYASNKIEDVFGVTHTDVIDDAAPLFDRIHGDDAERVMAAVDESARRLTPFYQQFRMHRAAGEGGARTLDWVEVDSEPEQLDDGSILWHGFTRRITHRKRMEEKLVRLAYLDELTELPNRARLMALLEDELARARAHRQGLALLYLDMDNFNDVNDAWGHATGDQLLKHVADRLSKNIDGDEVLARIGGDEFVIVVRREGAARRAEELASTISRRMGAPIHLDERQVRMTFSTGISLFPDDGETTEDLIRHADAALFKAKAFGPGHWARYTPELTEAARARRYLESELRTAIDRHEFDVALQPIVSLEDSQVVAVEALARWNHRQDGWIAPDVFIAMAEKRGLIAGLGDQIYRKAMAAVVKMPEHIRLAINVTPSQLGDAGFTEYLVGLAGETGLDPRRLVVELTERVFMQDTIEPLEQIERLQSSGMSVVIDDFGTGYSSLEYLRRLPVKGLKIDRSFVRHIEDDTASAAIVRAVSSLARDLGMEVTAEGVETRSEADFVRRAGCNLAQGWYFGRPEIHGQETGIAAQADRAGL